MNTITDFHTFQNQFVIREKHIPAKSFLSHLSAVPVYSGRFFINISQISSSVSSLQRLEKLNKPGLYF